MGNDSQTIVKSYLNIYKEILYSQNEKNKAFFKVGWWEIVVN